MDALAPGPFAGAPFGLAAPPLLSLVGLVSPPLSEASTAPLNASGAWASPPPAPPLPPASSGSTFSFASGDQLLLTCANTSSPICFSTAVSGSNLITALWFDAMLGVLLYLAFVGFRAMKGFEFYEARLHLPQVSHKPPLLKLHGHYRLWSWLIPVLRVTDEQLVQSSGLDALIAVRILSFGILLFVPITVGGMVILAVNYTDSYYLKSASELSVSADDYSTIFMRMTMSNIQQRSPRLWVHFSFVYLFILWACWLILEFYKEWIAIRQTYMIKTTELTASSNPGTPSLLAPTPSRSPLKKAAMLARPSPHKHSSSGGAGAGAAARRGNGGPANGASPAKVSIQAPGPAGGSSSGHASGASSPHARRHSRLLLPRRNKSRAGDEEFNFGADFSFHQQQQQGGLPLVRASSSDVVGQGMVFGLPAPPSRNSSNASLLPHSHKPSNLGLGSDAAQEDSTTLSTEAATPRLCPPAAAEVELAAMGDGHGEAAQHAAGSGELGNAFSSGGSLSLRGSGEVAGVAPGPPSAAQAASVAAGNGLPDNLPPGRPVHSPASSFDAAGGAVVAVTMDEVFAAIAAQQATTTSSSGEIPAAGFVRRTDALEESRALPNQLSAPVPAALAEAVAGPACSEPIGRWWIEQLAGERPSVAGLPSSSARLAASQSITYKGAVPLVHQPGRGVRAAANASLFTVLVLDMPVERLTLRRLGVLPASLEHMMRLPGAEQDDAAASPLSPDEMHKALDDMERGQEHQHARANSKDGSSSSSTVGGSGRGLFALVAHVRGLWAHRHHYGEWRRDIRWTMYNKRVRVATEMFTELFRDDFDSIIPIYDCRQVDKLLGKWERKQANLERVQWELREVAAALEGDNHQACGGGGVLVLACGGRQEARLQGRVDKLSRRAATLQGEIAELQELVLEERDEVLCDLPSTCFFATFRSQQAAAIASQANLNPQTQRLFRVEPAPRPEDVNWPALGRSWWERTMRPVWALPLVAVIVLLPIGAFTGAFAQLTLALCGSPLDPSSSGAASGSWFCSSSLWATFLRNLITAVAPSLLLSLYHMIVLPVLVYYAAQMEGQEASLSGLDRRCASLFWWFDVLNVFLGGLLGGTIFSGIQTFLNDPSAIWEVLGQAIPASSNFFVSYVIYRALVMSCFRLMYPHQRVLMALFETLRIKPRAKTPRDRALMNPPRNCRYGRDIGIPVIMNFVMVFAYCVVSPIIIPFGLLYFLGLYAVWRYQMLYVYQRQYESGGMFWPFVAHKVVGCMFIMSMFTAVVFLVKSAFSQAALMFITVPIMLLMFDNYITRRFDDLVQQTPLMAVHRAGRGRVDPEVYTPPPLHAGCSGWNPEWGKVWQFWGIPRYTI